MADPDFLGRGWGFPFAATNSAIALSEGEENIEESVMLILGTAKGERVMRPDFGCEINQLAFAVNNTATSTLVAYHVKEALKKWEPRIEVLDVRVSPGADEGNRLNINVSYRVKSINVKKNLVYPFYLEGKEV